MKTKKRSVKYGLCALQLIVASSGSVLAQQTTTLNYLDTTEDDWKRSSSVSLGTIAPGHVLTDASSGVALYRDELVPSPAAPGAEYQIGGTYHITHQTSFGHGFWDDNGVDGFAVEFANRAAAGADDILLVVNGTRTSLLNLLSFDLDNVDRIGTAYLEYKFTFTHQSNEVWNVSGELLNDKGAPLVEIDSNFRMADFRATRFGVVISDFPLPTADIDLGANTINGLAWSASSVPEPSSTVLFALAGVFLAFRRSRK